MNNISKKTIAEMAMQTVIMDAIEKGHTSPAELSQYVKSDVFIAAVKNCIELFTNEFSGN